MQHLLWNRDNAGLVISTLFVFEIFCNNIMFVAINLCKFIANHIEKVKYGNTRFLVYIQTIPNYCRGM